MSSNIIVVIPTYNEADNVKQMISDLFALSLSLDLLFVDDHSPDGTGQILTDMATLDPRIKVLHRPGKMGVGSAHRDGVIQAYHWGYRQVITMDCDFTHPPQYIKAALQAAQHADLVIASRYMKKDSLDGWNLWRKFLTHTGHFLTKLCLGMPYDATGGFRIYNLHQIPISFFALVTSQGYSFFFESLYVLFLNGFKIREIPIDLPPRTYGHSKMGFDEIIKSLKLLVQTYVKKTLNHKRFILPAEEIADLQSKKP